MHFLPLLWLLVVSLCIPGFAQADEKATNQAPREALRPLNDLIGSWKGTGTPEGSLRERQKGFWTERLTWEWQFKEKDAWFKLTIEKGKFYTGGELRYQADKGQFQLTLTTTNKEKFVFIGKRKDTILTLDREDETKKESQRIVLNALRANRFLFDYSVKKAGNADFAKVYQVGASKEGESIAVGDSKPECIVSGGLGKITVDYKGKTYYVCCSGCKSEFKADPEKYIKEAEAKKGK